MQKRRVNVYVDGFNVYHVLKNQMKMGEKSWEAEMKWCNLRTLAESYLQEDEIIGEIYFFTADSWIQSTKERGKKYYNALNEYNVTIIKGQYSSITKTFMDKMKVILFKLGINIDEENQNLYLPKILKYKTYEEKRTDVNIAIKILEDAFLGKYDRAIIMSGDSDIVPAIESVKKNFPKKSFSTLWIVGTKGQLIKDRCDTHHVIGYKTMKKHILPHRIKTKHGNEIQIPEEWLT